MIRCRNMICRRRTIFLLLGLILFITSVLMIKVNAVNNAKAVPFKFIIGFEERYLHNSSNSRAYKLIDTIEFELSKDNPAEVYENKNGVMDMIFSFVETKSPISFSIYKKNDAATYSGGFVGDTAVNITLTPGDDYRFEYKLGFKDDTNQTGDLVDFASGRMNIYQVM